MPVTLPSFLFDLDGTLADTLGDIAASTNHVRGAFDLPPLPDAAVQAFVGDGARTLLRRALAGRLPDAPEAAERTLDGAFRRYAEHHDAQCLRTVRTFPGVHEHLQELASAGHRLAVVTNKPERFAVPIVRHLGLAELLPVVVGGDTLPLKKPDPAPLRLALERLGSPTSAPGSTMVGDSVQDVRAGRAAGLRTIACTFGYGDPVRLRGEGADVFWRAFGMPE